MTYNKYFVAVMVVAVLIGSSWLVVFAKEQYNEWQLNSEIQSHIDAKAEAETSADKFRSMLQIAQDGINAAKAAWKYHDSELQRLEGIKKQ